MLPLIITVIIDIMGSNITLPLLPALLISSGNILLPAGFDESCRYMLYGLCMAAWPLGIFLGTPYLSSLSDTYGRKRILILALLGTAIALIVSALSIIAGSFLLFLLSRFVNGFFSGTFSIAQASVSHMSENYHDKLRKLGWLSFAGTIGAMLGPLLSGYLVKNGHSGLNLSLPFGVAALFCFINITSLYFWFKEPQYLQRASERFQLNRLIQQVYTNLKFIFVDQRTRTCMILFSLLQLGWGAFIQSLPLLLSTQFHLSVHRISLFFMTLAMSLGIAQLTLRPLLTKWLQPMPLFMTAACLLGLSAFILAFSKNLYLTYTLASFSVMIEMIAYTGIISLFSNAVSTTEQGKVMGGTAAIFGITWMISGILTGQLSVIAVPLPMALCGFFTLLSGCIPFKKGLLQS